MKQKSFDLTLTFKISKKDIETLVVNSLEGGIGHWACLDTTTSLWGEYRKKYLKDPCSIVASKILLDGHSLEFTDSEDGEHLPSISLKDVLSGITKYIEEYLGFTSSLADWDAEAADTIWQYGMFGELVYS